MAGLFSALHSSAVFEPYGVMSGTTDTLKGVSEHVGQLFCPFTDILRNTPNGYLAQPFQTPIWHWS